MVNFGKLSVQIFSVAEIYYLFADIYLLVMLFFYTFASEKENNK